MRIALVNEGTYPYATGGVSTWCDHLVRGLPEVTWHLVSIVGTRPGRPVLSLPANVASLSSVPVWGEPRPPRVTAVDAAVRLCQGMLGDTAQDLAMFRDALRELAMPDRHAPRRLACRCRTAPADCRWHRSTGRHPLFGVPLADILVDTWATVAGTARRPWPTRTLSDADEAAALLEHAVRPLAASLPGVDLCHANANGLSSLVAMAAKWRDGTPFIMTEHGVYLRERYLSSLGQSPAVKMTVLRFHRALARLAYREADQIAPVSSFNRRWEERHGADPGKVTVIPNGVDPERFPPLSNEPLSPTIAWVGRIDPLKDLETLIRALAIVRESIPETRLYLAGPVPAGNEAYARDCGNLVDRLGLADHVTFAGPVNSSREAFAAGHMVALSSISEGMPYTVVEAMMCGRATVNTDVGGVAELVGDTGLVVPPRDPAAFAEACVTLLTHPQRRRDLGLRARSRAVERYTLRQCLTAYRERYASLLHPVPAKGFAAVPPRHRGGGRVTERSDRSMNSVTGSAGPRRTEDPA